MRILRGQKNANTSEKVETRVRLASKQQIHSFVDFYKIKIHDFEPSDAGVYPTFEDFFGAYKPGSRPIFAEDDPSRAVVVADSRAVVYETVEQSKKLWIKGLEFSITNLVMDTPEVVSARNLRIEQLLHM